MPQESPTADPLAQDKDRQRRTQQIMEIARERLKFNPNDADALFAMAAAQGTLGDAQGGVQSLERLARLSPEYPGLWVLKTKLHARLGQADLAQQSRLRAAQSRPDAGQPSGSTEPCPMCDTPILADATKCPNCGVAFAPTPALEDELDELGYAAIQEIVQEKFKGGSEPSSLDKTPAPATPTPKPAGPSPVSRRPPLAAQAPEAFRPSATDIGAPRGDESPEERAALRRRVQRAAKGAQERLRHDERDVDALFALAASEAVLGGAAVAVTLLDRLEALDANYPGLWDLKSKLYATLGDAERWQEARKRADRVYQEAVASSPDRVPCRECGAQVPAAAQACPVCGQPVGRERDLQELDTLVDSMLGKEVPEESRSAEVAPQVWNELAALAAVEPAVSLEDSEASPPLQERATLQERAPLQERADDQPMGRGRGVSPQRPSSLGKPHRSLASSPMVKFGLPIALVAAFVLLSLVFITGGPWGPSQDQIIAKATPQINGLNLNPAYGDVMGATPFSFTVTVAQNSYLAAKDVRPLISVTNLTLGTDVVLLASFDGVTYSLASPTVTQQGFTFYYDFGTSFQRSVGAGATGASAPTWYFQFHYAVSNLPASVVTWNARFVTG